MFQRRGDHNWRKNIFAGYSCQLGHLKIEYTVNLSENIGLPIADSQSAWPIYQISI